MVMETLSSRLLQNKSSDFNQLNVAIVGKGNNGQSHQFEKKS